MEELKLIVGSLEHYYHYLYIYSSLAVVRLHEITLV